MIGLALSGLCVALFAVGLAGGEGAAAALQYDRARILDGEGWRLVTGHLVHWTPDHLLWSVAVLAGLGWLLERDDRRLFLAVVASSTLAIPLVLLLAQPATQWYRGVSGVDTALYVAMAVRGLARAPRSLRARAPYAALLVGVAGKLAFELATGGAVFAASAGEAYVPVPLAHAVGGGVGAGCVAWARLRGPSSRVRTTTAPAGSWPSKETGFGAEPESGSQGSTRPTPTPRPRRAGFLVC